MNVIKYFSIQFVLCCVIIFANFYLDQYISKPFSYTDLLAIITGIAIIIICFNLYIRFQKHIKPFRKYGKVLISLLAIIVAIIFIGVLTGEMQF
ncbi:hypothetical protein [Fredinandcohnia sp. 179-A 10B2 NHS]|uniref:hypothetical protein n=1 Tax=Fredinandcohnia sp. 179-A 10B2 NHS TaxID=3235176 RepID=UPI0039A2DF45